MFNIGYSDIDTARIGCAVRDGPDLEAPPARPPDADGTWSVPVGEEPLFFEGARLVTERL